MCACVNFHWDSVVLLAFSTHMHSLEWDLCHCSWLVVIAFQEIAPFLTITFGEGYAESNVDGLRVIGDV